MAKCVWALEKEELVEHVCRTQDADARGCLTRWFDTLPHDDAVRVAVTLWAIWYARRKVIHEGIFQSPLSTHNFINEYCDQLQVSKPQKQPKLGGQAGRCSTWIPPAAGQVKINVDAALSKNSRRIAVAAIARDCEGKYLGASGLVFEGITEPEIAEILACREGLDLASDLLVTSLRLASDCDNAIRSLKGDGMGPYGQIVKEINDRARVFSAVEFVHENRQVNIDAHCIARSLVLAETDRHVWFVEPPCGVCNYVNLPG